MQRVYLSKVFTSMHGPKAKALIYLASQMAVHVAYKLYTNQRIR